MSTHTPWPADTELRARCRIDDGADVRWLPPPVGPVFAPERFGVVASDQGSSVVHWIGGACVHDRASLLEEPLVVVDFSEVGHGLLRVVGCGGDTRATPGLTRVSVVDDPPCELEARIVDANGARSVWFHVDDRPLQSFVVRACRVDAALYHPSTDDDGRAAALTLDGLDMLGDLGYITAERLDEIHEEYLLFDLPVGVAPDGPRFNE